jgi:hypothetical protein
MSIPQTRLALGLMICAAVLGAKSAQAGGFKFGGGSGNGGNGNSSFKINHGSNNSSQNQFKNGSSFSKFLKHNLHDDHHGHHHHHHHKYYPKYHVRYVEPVHYLYSKCYHPPFQCCYVYPGDTWYTISKRIYGVDYMCKHIAAYNGLAMGSPLTVGQMLRLPVINANGSLAASSAPMPAPINMPGASFGPQGAPLGTPGIPNGLAPQGLPNGASPAGLPQGLPNGMDPTAIATQGAPTSPVQNAIATTSADASANVAPAANIQTVSENPTLPKVAIGSTLVLDGKSLGTEQGNVRLRMGTLTLPVEVLEWSADSVKIQLPKMELSRSVKASLEVVRADGSLASSSAIELSPSATRLALGN